ncbi:GAF domain-containing protein [Methylobacterium sp. J-068]|uniref:GAF domain-containing protein n=1 Tax=Methylobacterium sp. J-068 TaxID=2836649 RepID=UPI001FBB3F0D|nr:GAF domain-containing protein [Methylobacterium sp. J-068]MCJ2035577.1 GAF domain-containing protein [Methylobacterium sp. J-068]
MIARPPIPPEVEVPFRLAALDAYDILDTPPEKGFDDIVLLARKACGTSVALISLVTGDRQWFKARVGFEMCETSLDGSVCAHTLGRSEILVIPDLTQDPRTRANILVTGKPYIRFYAGAPLVSSNGEAIGSLCVIDGTPRPEGLTPDQQESLRALAGQVMAQLELRRALAERDSMLAGQRATVTQHEALLAVQEAMAASGDGLDGILKVVVDGAMRALPQAEGAVVEMREGDELVYRSGTGSLGRHSGLRLPVHNSLAGACLLSRTARVVADVFDDPNVKRTVAEHLALRSCVVVPLYRAGEGIGVLKVQSSRVGAFTERDMEVAGLFAGTVAAGISQVGEAEARRSALVSQSRYKAVFDSAIDYAIIVLDRDGIVTDWNAGAATILGWEPGEMCGKPADTFFTPEDREDRIPAKEMAAALETGRGTDERWHLRANGERFWANGEMMVLRDEAGEAVGFVKMLRDRTEQRLAAEALRMQTDLLQTVTDHVGQAVFQMDERGLITFANPTAEAMFGWSVSEFHGRNLHELLHHSHPDGSPFPASECNFVDALRHGRTMVDREDTFFRKDGTTVKVLATNAPVHVKGAVTSAVLTVSDITARKASERRLDLLAQASTALLDASDPASALGPILEDGAAEIGFDRSFTYDADMAYGTLVLTHTVGVDDAGRTELRCTPFASTLCGLVAELGRSVVLTDLQGSHEPRHAFAKAAGITAYAGYPILSQGRVSGVISFGSGDKAAFDDETLTFFETVARFLSIARERLEDERKLTASEARWRGLFENMQEGFFVGEVVRDSDGKVSDYRYLKINPAFSRQSGLPSNCVGRTIREFVPDIDPGLIATYGRVVETGRPTLFDITVPGLGRSFEVRVSPDRGERFTCLFLDVTAQRGNEARQAALIELGDRLRNLSDRPCIAAVAAEIAGRTLGLSHAGYGTADADRETITIERDWSAPGLGTIPREHRFRDYGSYIEELKRGETVVIDDVTTDPRSSEEAASLVAIQATSLVNIPLMEHGRFVALFFMLSGHARTWTADEIGFLRNVADRTRSAIARSEAEGRQDLLNHELSHRMKNLLAMVQAIATQTLRGATDIVAVGEKLSKRLIALGKAHDVLLGGTAEVAGLDEAIRGGIGLLDDGSGRITYEGPDIQVGGPAALSLGLMLHELSTNAAKYGALSRPEGRVSITWSVDGEDGEPMVHLAWRESGGPPVSPPSRKGFGSRLIERGLVAQVGGTLKLEYPSAGVTCLVEAPLRGFQ